MNKKFYVAPTTQSFRIKTEGMIAASSQLNVSDDDNTAGYQQLSNEMENSWSNEIWGDEEM